jgi:hypothetical protein
VGDGKIMELRRWERCSYRPEGPDGPEIQMELKRLKRHEAKALRKLLLTVFGEIEKSQDASLTAAQKATIVAQIFEAVPEDDLRQLFTGSVRSVQNLSIDNEPITTGAQLLDEADDSVLLFVLMNLQRLASLTSTETFRSGSPRTSSAAAASQPALPASGAMSTASVDGAPPSDVTAPEPAASIASVGTE